MMAFREASEQPAPSPCVPVDTGAVTGFVPARFTRVTLAHDVNYECGYGISVSLLSARTRPSCTFGAEGSVLRFRLMSELMTGWGYGSVVNREGCGALFFSIETRRCGYCVRSNDRIGGRECGKLPFRFSFSSA